MAQISRYQCLIVGHLFSEYVSHSAPKWGDIQQQMHHERRSPQYGHPIPGASPCADGNGFYCSCQSACNSRPTSRAADSAAKKGDR
jgi:hypothetical protein